MSAALPRHCATDGARKRGTRSTDHFSDSPTLSPSVARDGKTDPLLTRRGFTAGRSSRKFLLELVELMGIEPMTS